MRVILGLLLGLAVAQPALAGAWAREKGQVFLSFGSSLMLPDGSKTLTSEDPSVYIEYGLTGRLTVGLDYHRDDPGSQHTGFVFARFPLGNPTQRDKFAASFALGGRVDDLSLIDPLIQGGLSWGRGLDNGWLAVDASATRSSTDPTFRPKVDLTWGSNLKDDWTSLVQLQIGRGLDDTTYTKIQPAIIYNVNDTARISLGSTKALSDDSESTLKLDLWLTF